MNRETLTPFNNSKHKLRVYYMLYRNSRAYYRVRRADNKKLIAEFDINGNVVGCIKHLVDVKELEQAIEVIKLNILLAKKIAKIY